MSKRADDPVLTAPGRSQQQRGRCGDSDEPLVRDALLRVIARRPADELARLLERLAEFARERNRQ